MTLKSFLIAGAVSALAWACQTGGDGGAGFNASCDPNNPSECESGLCHPGGYCTVECGSCESGFSCVPASIGGESTGICARTNGGNDSDSGIAGAGGGGGVGGFGGAGNEGGVGGAGNEGGFGGAGNEGGGGAGGGGAGLDCAGIVDCLNDCGDDQVCAQDCVDQGTPAAQELINEALACLQANGGDQAACQEEIGACVGAGPQPMGDLTCGELNTCLSNCAEGDNACIDDCVSQASAEGLRLFQEAVACIEDNGGNQEACQAEIEACLGGGPQPMGDLTCGELNDCLSQCPEGDQACVDGCFGEASPQGLALFEAAVQCINDNGGDQAACQAEIEACLGPAAPPGNDTCLEVLDCIVASQTEEAAQACFEAGTASARTLIQDAFTCFNENMCQDPNCAECAAEYGACEADQ